MRDTGSDRRAVREMLRTFRMLGWLQVAGVSAYTAMGLVELIVPSVHLVGPLGRGALLPGAAGAWAEFFAVMLIAGAVGVVMVRVPGARGERQRAHLERG
jgi:hypothetical protein